MNADRLLEHYEKISDAPDAIVRLRRFVLDLAVRGKLVAQISDEEPASVLLKKIEAEKAERLQGIRVSTAISLENVSALDQEFLLPSGWIWQPLGNIIKLWNGFAFKSADFKASGVPVIRIGNLVDGEVSLSSAKCVTDETANSVSQEVWIPENALLLAMSGATTGKTAFNRTGHQLLLNQRVGRIEAFSTSIKFVRIFFETVIARNLSISLGSAIPNLSSKQINETAFPLPPLAEQHRIVAKVDELMALCDRLEEARKTREETRNKLTAASLGRLTAADTTPEDFPAHARFALETLPTLTFRPDQIKTLRQTILNLAVQGKLVEQDEADGSGEQLLVQVRKRKKEDVEPQEMKRSTKFSCNKEDLPFSLPASWSVAALRELSYNLGDGLHGTPNYISTGNIHFINGTNLRDGQISILPNTKLVSQEEYEKHAKPLNERTLLVSINGTLTNYAFYNGERVLLGKSACYFEISPLVDMQFIRILIQTPYYVEYAIKQATGATIKNLSLKAMNGLPVPLPPLAEQHRIVAKVDALMTLCDQLEASLTTTATTRNY